jgi:hypothetical protein
MRASARPAEVSSSPERPRHPQPETASGRPPRSRRSATFNHPNSPRWWLRIHTSARPRIEKPITPKLGTPRQRLTSNGSIKSAPNSRFPPSSPITRRGTSDRDLAYIVKVPSMAGPPAINKSLATGRHKSQARRSLVLFRTLVVVFPRMMFPAPNLEQAFSTATITRRPQGRC